MLSSVLSLSSGVLGQGLSPPNQEEGDPAIEHFDTKALGFDVVNWSCVRDSRGILWTGNSNGLLEYDGHSWRLLPSTNDTPVYDVINGGDGAVYFGLRGAFGRVAFEADGRPRMDMLSDQLPSDAPLLTEVYSVLGVGKLVYFVSEEAICRWDGKACTVIASDRPLGRSFASRGRLYVNVDSVGLCTLEKDRFVPIPGGDIFARKTANDMLIDLPDKIICLYHDSQGRLIVGSRMRGIFRYDGRKFDNIISFDRIPDPLWMPTRAEKLANGMLAVGSTHSGIWIFDSTGTVRRILDGESGLNGGTVNNLYVDADQNIWVALDDGITRIEWPGEPITRFGAARGLHGQVTAIRRFGGTLYAATTQGLYQLRSRPSFTRRGIASRSEFELIPSIRSTVFSILETGDALLVATAYGVFGMDRSKKLHRVTRPGRGARVFHPLNANNDTILVGSHRGLYLLMRSGTGWIEHTLSDRREDFVLSITEEADGTLWVGTAQHGACRIDMRGGAMYAQVRDFDRSKGIPAGPIVPVHVGHRTLFLTNDRPFAFDDKRGVFYPDTLFLRSFRKPLHDFPRFLQEDITGRVWMQFFEGNTLEYAVPRREGNWLYHMAPFLQLDGDVIAIHAEADGVCWIGTDDAVYRFDPFAPRRSYRLCETLIRSVSVNAVEIFFGGGAEQPGNAFQMESDTRDVEFNFASGNIWLQDCMLFRWRLDGLDTSWSLPTSMHTMQYSDLPAGDYVFRVQALIPGQRACDDARFAFTILPPWYARWWIWGLVLLVLIVMVIAGRSRRRSVV